MNHVLGVLKRAEHPTAVHLELPVMAFGYGIERRVVAVTESPSRYGAGLAGGVALTSDDLTPAISSVSI